MAKVAVISGCNRGIGFGIMTTLARAGYMVYGLNRTLYNKKVRNFKEIRCDVSKPAEVKSAVARIGRLHGKIDVVVANAAIRRFGSVSDLKERDWIDSVNVNLNGAFFLAKYSLPLLQNSRGNIIFLGSHAEKYPFPTGSAYCVTKAGLRVLAECMLDEVRFSGIKVTYLSVGAVKNKEHGIPEDWKLSPAEVGSGVLDVLRIGRRPLVFYVDLRPSTPLRDERRGIDRLQYM